VEGLCSIGTQCGYTDKLIKLALQKNESQMAVELMQGEFDEQSSTTISHLASSKSSTTISHLLSSRSPSEFCVSRDTTSPESIFVSPDADIRAIRKQRKEHLQRASELEELEKIQTMKRYTRDADRSPSDIPPDILTVAMNAPLSLPKNDDSALPSFHNPLGYDLHSIKSSPPIQRFFHDSHSTKSSPPARRFFYVSPQKIIKDKKKFHRTWGSASVDQNLDNIQKLRKKHRAKCHGAWSSASENDLKRKEHKSKIRGDWSSASSDQYVDNKATLRNEDKGNIHRTWSSASVGQNLDNRATLRKEHKSKIRRDWRSVSSDQYVDNKATLRNEDKQNIHRTWSSASVGQNLDNVATLRNEDKRNFHETWGSASVDQNLDNIAVSLHNRAFQKRSSGFPPRESSLDAPNFEHPTKVIIDTHKKEKRFHGHFQNLIVNSDIEKSNSSSAEFCVPSVPLQLKYDVHSSRSFLDSSNHQQRRKVMMHSPSRISPEALTNLSSMPSPMRQQPYEDEPSDDQTLGSSILPPEYRNHVVDMSSIPSSIVKTNDTIEDCAICHMQVEVGERRRILSCSHSAFHSLCIERWFRTNTTCPLCRAEQPGFS